MRSADRPCTSPSRHRCSIRCRWSASWATITRCTNSNGWRERGIDWSGVERAAGESFRWKGKYSYDLQSRETLETRLGVFADFSPKLPPGAEHARMVFLGNIDPVLQLRVLDQVKAPAFCACDTMNYWIQSKRDDLLKLLKRVDMLMVNDGEARELSGDWNIHRAGRWILEHGPKRVVIKQGEYGALLIEAGRSFHIPAYPLEEVFDPTGAGDAFAGGFMGYLARAEDVDTNYLRRAMVYGATMGSYSVSGFGIRGFEGVTREDVEQRVRRFVDLTHVPVGGAQTVTSPHYAAAGVDLDAAEDAKARIGAAGGRHAHGALRRRRSARSAEWSGYRPACGSRRW